MYFWSIEKLKAEMASGPLSEREVLPYLIVFLVLSTVNGCIPQADLNIWGGLSAAWSIALAVAGTVYIYRQNGGAHGQHFLQRYLAVGWVVTLRWIVAMSVAFAALFAVLEAIGTSNDDTSWYDFLFIAAAETALYSRIGHHVRDIALRTSAA